jgi:methionine sulfoxide reductase heme-binding subunit
MTSIENIFAFISVFFYTFTLLPSLLRLGPKAIDRTKFIKWCLRHRRNNGLIAWLFGFLHGTYIVWNRGLNLFEPSTAIVYTQGIVLITIFTLLAITSNQWSIKKLKKNWKRLHRLTYLALLVLFWHVFDKMSGDWSIFTALILVVLVFLILLFVIGVIARISKFKIK